MNTAAAVTRVCKCGCLETFQPHPNRPGQEYKYAHKKLGRTPLGGNRDRDIPTQKEENQEGQRRMLNYKLALMAARGELQLCEREIELADEDAEAVRDKIGPLQKRVTEILDRKDLIVERHGTLSATISQLEQLVGTPAAETPA